MKEIQKEVVSPSRLQGNKVSGSWGRGSSGRYIWYREASKRRNTVTCASEPNWVTSDWLPRNIYGQYNLPRTQNFQSISLTVSFLISSYHWCKNKLLLSSSFPITINIFAPINEFISRGLSSYGVIWLRAI